MLAKELVSTLYEYNSDYSRETLLQEINYVQKIIFGSANMYTLATDTSTGTDPQITPDTTEYTISGVMRIDRVYSSDYSCPLNVRIVGDTIYFEPEHVGQTYYVRYYNSASDLTSETMELLVPDEYIDVLEEGVVARIGYKEHGSSDEWKVWKLREMPKVRRKMNSNYKWGAPNGTKKVSTGYN